MEKAKMQMFPLSVKRDAGSGIVVITQPQDFEDDANIILTDEQCGILAGWLESIHEEGA